jgi:hypothetical protein
VAAAERDSERVRAGRAETQLEDRIAMRDITVMYAEQELEAERARADRTEERLTRMVEEVRAEAERFEKGHRRDSQWFTYGGHLRAIADRAAITNQCDGCVRGLPLADGVHRGDGYDMIACTANLYAGRSEKET